MARFDFALFGDARLARNLAELPDKLERKILAQAITKATKDVLLPRIQAETPVGSPYTRVTRGRTIQGQQGTFRAIRFRREAGGRLRRSLRVRSLKRRRGRVGSLIQAGTRGQLGIRGRGYYPAHIEYGFVTATRRANARSRRVPAERYMKRPLLASRAAWLNAVAAGMRAGLEREVRP